MRKSKFSLIAALILCFALSACSGGNASNDSKEGSAAGTGTGASASAAASTGASDTTASKELDVLRVGVAELPANMDPIRGVGNATIRIQYNVFETLMQADQKNDSALKPMLATEWKRIDDKTLEVKLRQGVKFHNGDEMTAKDVVFSFDRLKQNIDGSELAASLLAGITSVQKIDDYTVRFVTGKNDPILEQRLASSWGSWIVPADYITKVGNEEFAAKPIGTGPYKVVSYSPDKVVLERFDDYWGEKPSAKRIEYVNYPETSARITALITGEADIITQLPPDQMSVIQNEPNLSVESLNISNLHMLVYNTSFGPLKDKKLRQALNLAIDRQKLSDALWGGKAIVPKGHQYPEFGDLYLDDYPTPAYDLEKAKQLVAESSYKGETIEYELKSNYYTFANEAAQAIVDMWKQIGVNAKVKFTDKVTRAQVSNWSNTMRFPDPLGGLWLLWGPETDARAEYWQDMPDGFIATGEEMESATDPAQRKELARKLMNIWDEEAPGTVLYYPYENWGVRKGLAWTPYPSQAMDFRADNFKVVE
ncbi:ABC transporter substrate-binding protein [Cohnella sp. JJ-181]|uniref:ABC transporter substrate-binding protein n=1 Tax=Cohnella rhizoplanae TaxID=2974897 RepID=UPI0022FF608F|nr:ABC transporter substrate-binding protein [Cohnella sp. JJ-181]CAI6085703.1 HTH-type transcriptional regulator SgrR [Cohnella sp. JJ-181]